MKVIQFKDGTYGLQRYGWYIPVTEYWNFRAEEWRRQPDGVNEAFRTTWEEAENTRIYLTDRGDTITISVKRWNQLLKAEDMLECLEAGGVDNWEWYTESLREYGFFDRVEEGIYHDV